MRIFEEAVRFLLGEPAEPEQADEALTFDFPMIQEESPQDIPPEVPFALFQAGVDLDEIAQKEEYRRRRNIAVLD